MDQFNTQPNQNNPTDQESFSLSNQPKKSGWKTTLIIAGVVLVVALFFAGGIFLRSYFSPKPVQAPTAQIPAGFTFPTANPPAVQTSTIADSISAIENDLNAINLKDFEAQIISDLSNISKSL